MAYTINPYLPKLRAEATNLVYRGWSVRKTARRFGVNPSTVSRWVDRSRGFIVKEIPTLSSRPHHHPDSLPIETIKAIIDYRLRHRRCAKVIHYLMTKDGYQISLSSIERVLRRCRMVNHSRFKKWHTYPPRPMAEKPGILVQIDTVWDGLPAGRLYLYTLLDVCSRWSHAWPVERISNRHSLFFLKEAQRISPFSFNTLQSDHGSEFSLWFTGRVQELGLVHRHSRVRTPSDNGHLERFNRTIQEECIQRIPRNLAVWKKEVPEYLDWYNTKRPHMALGMKTPLEVLRSY